MNETLGQIRINALHYSEKEMATKLQMSLSDYKKIENDNLDIVTLMKLSQSVGKPIDDLLCAHKQEVKFVVNDAWKTVGDLKCRLQNFFSQFDIAEFKELLSVVEKMVRKPRIALVGRSDVGKSTLINALIGNKTLPEAWTPTTSIIIYVKHLSDRPAYCKSNVMIFKSDISNNIWDDVRLSEEEYTRSLCIADGDYLILKDYASRQGDKFNSVDATSAVVFVESDILNNCDLIDMPGYGTKDRELDDSLLRKIRNVDVLIYMSVANGFMRGDDINWLQDELPNLSPITLNNKKLKPLSNLYIIASQAHIVSNGAQDVLDEILAKGAERFERTLSPNYWNNLGQPTTTEDFEKRFFTYSIDQESLRVKFEKDLKNLLTILPEITNHAVLEFVQGYVNDSKEEIESKLRSFREIIGQREEKKRLLQTIEENELKRINDNENEKKRIIQKINYLLEKSKNDIISGYNKVLTVDNIVNLIDNNKWKKKDDDIKQLSAKLSNLLNDSYSDVLKKYSLELTKEIDKYLEKFENSAIITDVNSSVAVKSAFNYKASFASGLVGVAAYGALSVWAASLGNLGAYIILAKGVGLLSAMGISVGGTAVAASAIAAIGGPIVLAVGIVVVLSALAFVLLSGRWKKDVAKKFVEEYDKKRVVALYVEQNETFWKDTSNAFISCAKQLEDDYEKYLSTLKREVYDEDDKLIECKISDEESKLNMCNLLLNYMSDGVI